MECGDILLPHISAHPRQCSLGKQQSPALEIYPKHVTLDTQMRTSLLLELVIGQ